MWVTFALQKLLTFLLQKNINVNAIFQDRNINIRAQLFKTNDVIS